MANDIIINNLAEEFRSLNSSPLKQYKTSTAGLMKPAVVDDTSKLPESLRRKMKRTASSVSISGLRALNIKLSNPTFYHPLFQPVNMLLPRDRRERNEWCRHFYRTEPIVATAIDIHTESPVSNFSNSCYDPAIKKFFDYMVFEKLDIINLLFAIGHEYWKIGDVFPFGTLNTQDGIWERFTLLNPDYINIRTSVFADDAIIELIPDDQITSIVNEGPRGENAELYRQMPPEVIRAIKMNRYIKLDNRLVTHIAHKASEYEPWGTPLMMRCFKALIYKDKLRAAQDAIANRHVFPIRLAKLGTPGEPYPTQTDLDSFRDLLLLADDDPYNFIVYHYGVQMDYVGSSGKILPLNTEFDFVQKELMAGLGINEAQLNGQTSSTDSETSIQKYAIYRYKLENFIINKIYKPIAEIQGFYKPAANFKSAAHLPDKSKKILAARGDMELVIPTIQWQQKSIIANSSAVQIIQSLQQAKLVSNHTMLSMVGLNPDVERKNLENERGTVFDKDAPKNGPLLGMPGYVEKGPDDAPDMNNLDDSLASNNNKKLEKTGILEIPDMEEIKPKRLANFFTQEEILNTDFNTVSSQNELVIHEIPHIIEQKKKEEGGDD